MPEESEKNNHPTSETGEPTESPEQRTEGFGENFIAKINERIDAFVAEITKDIEDSAFIAKTDDAKKMLKMMVARILSPDIRDYSDLKEILLDFAQAHKRRREEAGQPSDIDPGEWAESILAELNIENSDHTIPEPPVTPDSTPQVPEPVSDNGDGIEPTPEPATNSTAPEEPPSNEEDDETNAELTSESMAMIEEYIKEHPQFTWAQRIIAVQQRTQDIIATIAVKFANRSINKLINTRLQGSEDIGVVKKDIGSDNRAISSRQREISDQNRERFINGRGGLIDRLYGSRRRERQLNQAEAAVKKHQEAQSRIKTPTDEDIMQARTVQEAVALRSSETGPAEELTGKEIRRQEKFEEQLALYESINISQEQAEAIYWHEQQDRIEQQIDFLKEEMEVAGEELAQSKREVKEIEQSRQRLKSTIKILEKHPPEDNRAAEYNELVSSAEERLQILDQTMEVVAANIAGQTALIEQYRISIDQISFIAGLSNREPDVKKSRKIIAEARKNAMDGLEDYFKRFSADIPEVGVGGMGGADRTNRPSSVFLNFFLSTIMGVKGKEK